MTNIEVSVRLQDPIVFTGDDIACMITIKNVAPTSSREVSSPANDILRIKEPRRQRWRSEPAKRGVAPQKIQLPAQGENESAPGRFESQPTSPNATMVRTSQRSSSGQLLPREPNGSHKHGRSVSIVSIGPTVKPDNLVQQNGINTLPPDGARSHIRAASLQNFLVSPTGNVAPQSVLSSRVLSNNISMDSSRQIRPFASDRNKRSYLPGLENGTLTPQERSYSNNRGQRRSFATTGGRGVTGASIPLRIKSTDTVVRGRLGTKSNNDPGYSMPNPPGGKDGKVLSPTSTTATPRSSVELHSQSDHSTDTLVSEYRLPPKHTQQSAWKAQIHRGGRFSIPRFPSQRMETLMMGYVQLSGSFVLDTSLVNSFPFEDIKKRGVIGGQGGGGVVGIGTSKRDSGILGSLGWANLTQSFGGLIGHQDPSSLREMKGIANAKAVPIITTPQSILFVDLELQPGEERSFYYNHCLPQDLPPSCRGRAVKIAYQLTVGIQPSHSLAESHHLRRVDVPFKVLPKTQGNEEASVYDLKRPYIILQDSAGLRPVGNEDMHAKGSRHEKPDSIQASNVTLASFAVGLLENFDRRSSSSLLSPPGSKYRPEMEPFEAGSNSGMKEFNDLQPLRGDTWSSKPPTANKFDILRTGQRIATLVLDRPSYKLGDTILASADFHGADIACYTLFAHLETSEEINETLALRSKTSILRATRRIHASHFENSICARRVFIRLTVPFNSTPSFKTSGIQLKWTLRFEFTTHSQVTEREEEDLLEEVIIDERGRILAAAQELHSESFEVIVPISVVGAIDPSVKVDQPVSFTV